MKRYQIVKYDYDIGDDEGMDYTTIQEAIEAAKSLLKDYESIIIYDHLKRAVRHAFNGIPDRHFSKDVDTTNTIYHWRQICRH